MKKKVFINLLLWNVIIAFGIGMFVGALIELLNLDVGDNEVEKMFEEYSPLMIFFLAVILAPIIEETIFRGPLVLFKNSKTFPFFFYILAFLFGFVHLFNFESYENAIWFAPFLFLPQLVTGVFLSYIRVRMGLLYSMLFHALFNLVLLGPFILLEIFKPTVH
ncbi:CPBP family intramembrane glutamic endopeptidase [Croceivirga thetidis]|uniref:CPBP family intramembrane metalloprotease n=1 Tax=Croceivirga thetidis TaxID=2721623 RepID=A0ABX1GQJ2_9FLAO|nr:CPBP family intramembrane glutamic endopeptidase [Croceivirga thetidis]NKI32169.1 CPBP family intramembrane metalloprotease [Croceivirga thetidis]